MSDNCDHNFGTFDDFGVKNDQKVSNNMILMSKYKGKHGGKKGQKIGAGVFPPFSGNARKKTFFLQEGFPNMREAFKVGTCRTTTRSCRDAWVQKFISPWNVKVEIPVRAIFP